MARWIHEFRSTGERALTDGERARLDGRARGLRTIQAAFAVLTIALFVGGLGGGIVMAAGGNPLGYVAFLASLFGGFYANSKSSDASKLALLHRRALRLGAVEEFRRVRGDETARRMWASVGLREAKDEAEQEDEPVIQPTNQYWRVDERFEESLRHTAGVPVETFAAVGRDGAILWVEGYPVRRLLEPPVWEVAGS